MSYRTISRRILSVLALSLFMVLPTFAMELAEAKSAGLVGETTSGYIAAVKHSEEVGLLVESINYRRRMHYQKIAEKNGISLQAVEFRAGQKVIEKTPAGEYIDFGDGWQKK